jgi:hypothetical protein
VNDHQDALKAQLDAALAEISASATATRDAIDGDIKTLNEMNTPPSRPQLIPDVPIDEPPPYIPPPVAPSANALIPDTPLLDSGSLPAFDDDAPLWQS